MSRPDSRLQAAAILAAVSLAVAGCSVNPATGERQLTLIGSQQEIALGRDADAGVRASFGVYPDDELQAYVQTLGAALAAESERPELPWSFAVVDDPIVNAFALPGGFIYVSRGILAHFGSEAELVSVLGHEIGHVTGRHGVEQMSKQQLAGLGLGVAMIASEEFRQWGGAASAGLQLMFLKFGRDHEREADSLGLRYLVRGGYDPDEMPRVFNTLDRVSTAAGGGRVPAWQSTHPDPGARADSIAQQVAALPSEQRDGRVERDGYLQRLAGLPFGPDPREGYAIGRTFYHPGLQFRLDFPEGWPIVNQKTQVVSLSPEEDAAVVLSLAQGTAEEAAREFFASEAIRQEGPWRGYATAFRTVPQQSGQPVYRGYVGFVTHEGVVMRLLGLTTDPKWVSWRGHLGPSVQSFHRLTEDRYLSVEPARIELVAVPTEMTFAQFLERYPSSVDGEIVGILNQANPGDQIPAGRLLKRVLGGELPTE